MYKERHLCEPIWFENNLLTKLCLYVHVNVIEKEVFIHVNMQLESDRHSICPTPVVSHMRFYVAGKLTTECLQRIAKYRKKKLTKGVNITYKVLDLMEEMVNECLVVEKLVREFGI